MIKKIKSLIMGDGAGQVIRFAMVGVLNTLISIVVYLMCIKLGMHYAVATAIGQVAGLVNSYIWNKKFTFKSGEKSVAEIIKFVLVYAVQYAANVGIVFVLINKAGLTKDIAGPIATIICTAISFVGHKFWSFKK